MTPELDTSEKALEERGRLRRMRMRTHRAASHRDAEDWDLAYWQDAGPKARLEAYMAIRDDVHKVEKARDAYRSGL